MDTNRLLTKRNKPIMSASDKGSLIVRAILGPFTFN
jgi:ribosomal protein S28E/S33